MARHKKKVMSEEERERRSIAMKAVYARKRAKKANVRQKRAYKKSNYPKDVHGTFMGTQIDPLPEWKQPDPIEVQLKDAHGTIERLQRKLAQYRAWREIVYSMRNSMSGMVSTINSSNALIDND